MHSFTMNHTGIVPFDDLSMLGFESVSLLDDFERGVAPTFTIVDTGKYIRDINSAHSSSARNSTLPPSFLLFVSYKPQNNTVLRLLSSYVRTVRSQAAGSPIAQRSPSFNTPESDRTIDNNDKGSGSELDRSLESGSGDPSLIPVDDNDDSDHLASLLLTSTATYLQEDNFLDLWSNISGTRQHNVVFMVVNGTISSCLDNEFKLGEPEISLWNENTTFKDEGSEGMGEEKETVQVKFSPALHAVHSVVSLR